MSFTFKNISGAAIGTIFTSLTDQVRHSRFTARLELNNGKLSIHQIRLKASKSYCGNHPYPCPVTPFERRHRKGKWLEGADWVGFNDLINDVLDDLAVDADVGSSLVTIRKGRKRCVRYEGYSRNFGGY